ncbi:hypothetical protein LCGC14_2180290 [marine sediment metagenome]|uniref:HNH nuclease domain-containing protein n=1 Tax=marine sediment metagenome TaxID=412755 RepID=A0A0F9DML1_9ZZZZ
MKCDDCNTTYKRKQPRPCKDGIYRCKNCIWRVNGAASYIKHKVRKAKNSKDWWKRNPGKITDYARAYRKRHNERVNARQRKYYHDDLEYQRLRCRSIKCGVQVGDIKKLLERQPDCQLCGTNTKLTVDHMHPVSRGGKGTQENIQSLCGPCNSWKSDKLFLADGSGYLVGESYGR